MIAVVRQAPREAIALKMGAQEVLNSKSVQVPERVKALTAGRGADVVIDNVGTEETVRMAIASLRPGSFINFSISSGSTGASAERFS